MKYREHTLSAAVGRSPSDIQMRPACLEARLLSKLGRKGTTQDDGAVVKEALFDQRV